ncbi:hypothetical protein ACIQZO_19620 [Streptomyces sp. NPDC097617]|uniref:hypothetical protein n=1 Tax=Streptomyces sp. NPDC097617 TaxID=3366091 RepID=UPI0037FE700A
MSASSTAPMQGTDELTELGEWDFTTTITDAPRPAVANCDTNDTCASTCDSSCASD